MISHNQKKDSIGCFFYVIILLHSETNRPENQTPHYNWLKCTHITRGSHAWEKLFLKYNEINSTAMRKKRTAEPHSGQITHIKAHVFQNIFLRYENILNWPHFFFYRKTYLKIRRSFFVQLLKDILSETSCLSGNFV